MQAAEGEFAFVIAVFAVDNDLISPDLYASIVLAVLISTILPPFALRFTISHYNKLSGKIIKQAEHLERRRSMSMDRTAELSAEEKERLLRVRGTESWTTRLSCIRHLPFPTGKHRGKQDYISLHPDPVRVQVGSHSQNHLFYYIT